MDYTTYFQIVGMSLTLVAFIVSEFLGFCPKIKANGIVHALTLWVGDDVTVVQEPEEDAITPSDRRTLYVPEPIIQMLAQASPRDLVADPPMAYEHHVQRQDQ
jgi:hypothetical protein